MRPDASITGTNTCRSTMKLSMNGSDTDIFYSCLSCCLPEELHYRDAMQMSSPNPKVFEHSWKLECQQRHDEEESEVNGVYDVHRSLRHAGFEPLRC